MTTCKILVSCVLLAVAAIAATAQPARETFQVGGRAIHIPAPDGFVSAYPHIPKVAAQVRAFQDPEGRTLTKHLPQSVASKIIAGEPVEVLPFYANIAVRKDVENIDITPEMFAQFVSDTERNFETLVDSAMPAAVENAKKSLSRYTGKDVDAGFSRPVNLGTIDKRPHVYSAMVMSIVSHAGKHTSMLGVMSYIVVKNRLLYVNIYKEMTTNKDAETLRDFSRKWADEIHAANR